MPEFPDANSGSLDPLGAPAPKCKLPLWRRVRAWTIIVGLYAIVLGMAAGAIPLLRSAFHPGVEPEDRLLHLLYAGGLLLPFLFMLRYFIRVRLKTGRWRGTPEQRRQEREQRLAKCSVAGGKTACAARRNSLFTYAIKWSSYTAFAPSCTPWQRSAAWLMLVLYALAVLAVAAFGIIAIGAAFDSSNTLTQTLLFVALGVASLIWPAIVAWKLIRGLRAGKLGATREELDALHAQRSAWAERESQRPLRSKLIGTAFLLGIYALWWIRVTVHHAQHPHDSWITPATWTPALLYTIWIQYRRPKSTPPADR